LLLLINKCSSHFNRLSNLCVICRRVVKPSLGLRVGSLGTQKLSICEQIHRSFPHAHGIYVEMVNFVAIHLIFSPSPSVLCISVAILILFTCDCFVNI
jgi:hypothetical protein